MKQYLKLLRHIRKNGVITENRTGTKTQSVFGYQMRFDLAEGFPLLTTKKVFWKGIIQELYWFMSGQENIKYLVDNGVHIWDDYPYRIYREKIDKGIEKEITKEEFVDKISKNTIIVKYKFRTDKTLTNLYDKRFVTYKIDGITGSIKMIKIEK